MKGKSRNLPARNAHRLNREGKLRRESKEKGRKKKRIKSRRKRFSQDINGGRFYFYGSIVDISGPVSCIDFEHGLVCTPHKARPVN